jgi:ketosteroid isomerase-like protein
MRRLVPLLLSLLTTLLVPALHAQATSNAALVRQVFVAESSFAASMANRDTAAFARLVSPEAVFFGQKSVMRGKPAVVAGWRPLFEEPTPPFSWKPEVIEVLASGNLALSSGPVYGRDGKQFGTFSSIWRREPDGAWRVIFDQGCPVCDCEKKVSLRPT